MIEDYVGFLDFGSEDGECFASMEVKCSNGFSYESKAEGEELKEVFNDLFEDYNKAVDEFEDQTKELEEINDEDFLEDVLTEVDRLYDSYQILEEEVSNITKKYNNLGKAYNELSEAYNRLSKENKLLKEEGKMKKPTAKRLENAGFPIWF